MTLAAAARERSRVPALPPLQQTQLALASTSGNGVSDEASLIVDSIETMAELLVKDVEGSRAASWPPCWCGELRLEESCKQVGSSLDEPPKQ